MFQLFLLNLACPEKVDDLTVYVDEVLLELIAFKIDLSIILIRGEVNVKGRLSIDPDFLGME